MIAQLAAMGAAALMALAGHAATAATVGSGVTIERFDKTTNDGVFTLTPEQAAFLGAPDADRIAFFRVREGRRVRFLPGDAFDERTLEASVRSGAGAILAFLNGEADGLGYQGGAFQPLGRTVIETGDASFNRGVAFLFDSSAGDIVFEGSATFNGAQTRGAFALPVPQAASPDASVAPIPLPGAMPLMAAGLGAFALLRLRRLTRRHA